MQYSDKNKDDMECEQDSSEDESIKSSVSAEFDLINESELEVTQIANKENSQI